MPGWPSGYGAGLLTPFRASDSQVQILVRAFYFLCKALCNANLYIEKKSLHFMKQLVFILMTLLLVSMVTAQSYASDIDLQAYGVDGTVKATADVKNVQVNPDGTVKADIDVQSNFQGNVNGQAVNSSGSGQYAIDAKAGESATVTGTFKGKDVNEIRFGEKMSLSNGKQAEIKIMPATASTTAIAKLSLKVCSIENNCTIQLKETGTGNETSVVYEVKAQKKFKVFGIFSTQGEVTATVNVEDGKVTATRRPWWSFIASESSE